MSSIVGYEIENKEGERLLGCVKNNLFTAIAANDISSIINSSKKISKLLSLKHKISQEDRVLLINIFTETICLPDVPLNTQIPILVCLKELTRKDKLLQNSNLKIKWEPLFQVIDRNFLMPSRSKNLFNEKKYSEAFSSFLVHARKYFHEDSTEEILKEFTSQMLPFDSSKDLVQSILVGFLPTSKPELWIKNIFKYLKWSTSLNWTGNWIDLLSRAAFDNVGKIEWSPHIPTIFSVAKSFLSLTNAKSPSIMNQSVIETNTYPIFHTTKDKIRSVSKLIVNMIDNRNSSFAELQKLIDVVEVYCHPLSSGKWTVSIAKLMFYLSDEFCQRVKHEKTELCKTPSEYRINIETIENFVKILKKPAFVMVFGKDYMSVNMIHSCIRCLAYLSPQEVLPEIIEKSYGALENLTETHRTTSVLSMLSNTAPILTSREIYPEGATHIFPLLRMTLPGIDLNDPMKTISTIQFVFNVSMSVFLCDCTNTEVSDLSELDNEIRSSTCQSEEWVIGLFERIFQMLENLPENHRKSKMTTETGVVKSIGMTLESVLFQMSQPLYQLCLDSFIKFITSNTSSSSKKACEIISTSFVLCNPKESLKKIIPICTSKVLDEMEQLKENKAETSNNLLVFYLSIIARSIQVSGEECLVYKEILLNILNKAFDTENIKVQKIAAKLLKNMLKSTTFRYPTDFKSVPPSLSNTEDFRKSPFLFWGNKSEKGKIEPIWHIPSEKEISFAVELLERFLLPSLEILNNPTREKSLLKSLLIVRYCVRGMVCLLPTQKPHQSDIFMRIPIFSGECLNDSHPHHQKVVEMRKNVIVTLHNTISLFQNEREDHIQCLKISAKIIQVLLTNRGCSRDKAESKQKGLEYYKNYSKDLINPKRPGARYLEIKKIHMIHINRQKYNSFNSDLMKEEEYLLFDLMHLSVNNSYSLVRKKAQTILSSCLSCFPQKKTELMDTIFGQLVNKGASPSQIKGALYTLKMKPFMNNCTRKWESQRKFMISMSNFQFDEKTSIQELSKKIFNEFVDSFQTIPIEDQINTKHLEKYLSAETQLNEKEVKFRIEKSIKKTSENIEIYIQTMKDLYEITTNSAHWKSQLISANFMELLIRKDIERDFDCYTWFYDSLCHELPQARLLSVKATKHLLYFAKLDSRHKQLPHKEENQGDQTLKDQMLAKPLDANDYETFIDQNGVGWKTGSNKYTISYPKRSKIESRRYHVEKLHKKVTTTEFWESFSKLHSHESNTSSDCPFRENIAQLVKGFSKHFENSFIDILLVTLEKLCKDSDKFSQRLAAEITAGLIRGSGDWSLKQKIELQKKLEPLLSETFLNSTPEALLLWGVALKFIFSNRDPRRFQWILDMIMKYKLDDHIQYSFFEKLKITFIQVILDCGTWRLKLYHENILTEAFRNISHPYKHTREGIASLIFTIIAHNWTPESYSPEFIDQFVSNSLNLIEKQRLECIELSPEQFLAETPLYVKSSKTLLGWLDYCNKSLGFTIEKYVPTIIPHVFNMIECNDRELQIQAKTVLDSLVALDYNNSESIVKVFSLIKEKAISSSSWHIRAKSFQLIQIIVLQDIFYFDNTMMEEVLKTLSQGLFDNQIEVRDKASQTLSSILRSWNRAIIPNLQKKFNVLNKLKAPQTKHRDGAKKVMQQEDIDAINKIHGNILGMSSLVLAFPFNVPPWMPSALHSLAIHSTDPDPIQTSVRKVLAEFKRTHQDSWHEDKNVFSEEQLSVLSDILISPSYYA